MKKILTTILALVYLGTSTGAVVHLHYCMGKLVNSTFLESKSDKCGVCGMEKSSAKKKSCCKDEHKQLKIGKDQKIAESAIQVSQSVSVETPSSFFEIPQNNFSSIAEKNPISHAPPRAGDVAVYVRNCIFLI